MSLESDLDALSLYYELESKVIGSAFKINNKGNISAWFQLVSMT